MFVGVWGGSLREGDHLEERGVNGRAILKWMLKEWDGGPWTGLRDVECSCECGSEPSGSIKCGEYVNTKSNQMQQYGDIYLLQSHSTCFGCHSTHHQEY